MYLVRPNWLMRKTFPSAIWRIMPHPSDLRSLRRSGYPQPLVVLKGRSAGPMGSGDIYITFDDGPIPVITPWVLDTLNEYNAKATFFCVGDNIEKHPDIFSRILSEGHSVGNHTYNHLNGWKTKHKDYLDNILKCNSLLNSYPQHVNPHLLPLFRPPYGKMKKSQIASLKSDFSIILWDVLSGDFDQTITEEKCLKNVLTKTRQGSIIVFHDSLKAKKNLFYTLPKFLEHFSKQGCKFSLLPAYSKPR
jgi:peptidoglycan-N-acetylglucosamine deacetylase